MDRAAGPCPAAGLRWSSRSSADTHEGRQTTMEMSAEAWSFAPNPEDPCTICTHTLGPHVFFATDDAPSEDAPSAGGLLICPLRGCNCVVLWGTATQPDAFVPSADSIARTRQFIQARPADAPPIGQTLATWSDDRAGYDRTG